MPNQIGPGYPGTPMQPGLQDDTADIPKVLRDENEPRETDQLLAPKDQPSPSEKLFKPEEDGVDGSGEDGSYIDGQC